MYRALPLALALLAPLALRAAEPLKIASLHTITTEIAQRVGGDRVAVTGLVKPGVDPHDFEPTPADLKVVAEAELVLAAGKGLEGYLDKLLPSSGSRASMLKVGDALPSLKLTTKHDDHEHKQGTDPHWWNSIGAVRKAVEIVRDRLTKLRPADTAVFARNAAAYATELDALKAWAAAEVAKLPRNERTLVTTHDAFGYFAKDFGFTIVPIRGVSSDDEPSSKKVAEIIATIKARKVRAIFPEALENPKVLAEITRETGARVGEKLYADGLGEGPAATYGGMYRENVKAVVTGLAAAN